MKSFNQFKENFSTAVQRGSWVFVYDEDGYQSFSVYGTLVGYTSNNVSVKRKNYVYTYANDGRIVSSTLTNDD